MLAKNYISALLFYSLSSILVQANTPINSLCSQFTGRKALQHASVGFRLVEVQSKKEICSIQPELCLAPASTLKVLTGSTVLELLGEDYQLPTEVGIQGTVDQQGLLRGDVYIRGYGDPSLGSAYLSGGDTSFLATWTQALVQAGIKAIEGNVVAKDGLYGYQGTSAYWTWQDMGNYYAPPVYGISVYDNSYKLALQSGAVGTQVQILETTPFIPNLHFNNYLRAASHTKDSAYIRGAPLQNERNLYGSIPAKRNRMVIRGDIPNPGQVLAYYFLQELERSGIRVSGEATTERLYTPKRLEPEKVLHTHLGAPVKELIKSIHVHSNNHFAEHLFYTLVLSKHAPNPTTRYVPQTAAQVCKEFWQQKGLDMDGLLLYDGCGLARSNGITAQILTDLLVYMQNESRYKDRFYYSLPLAGKEGTVRHFLKNTPFSGNMRVKSGSIAGVQAYCGYFNKHNKRYAFSLLINNFTANRAALKTEIESFLLGIYQDLQ